MEFFFLLDGLLSRIITLLWLSSKAFANCEARNPRPPVIIIVLPFKSGYKIFTIQNYSNFKKNEIK